MLAAGIACLAAPGMAPPGIALLLGAVMFFAGTVGLLSFAAGQAFLGWNSYILLLAFLLCNEWLTVLAVPFVFGRWLIFSGMTKFMHSFELAAAGAGRRGWALRRRPLCAERF